jgi:recombination associated protein RdgC
VYKPKNALPEEMELGQQVALKSENDSRAKLYKQDLFSSEISTLIDHGKQVHELGLQFNERVEFVMTHQCHLKKVKPTDLFYDGLDEHIEGVSYLENYEPHWFLLCAFLVEIFDWMHSEFEIPTPNDSQKAQE